jgi:hypothetical protein
MQAQSIQRSVIGSAGGIATGTNLSVSYTAGEVITAPLSVTNIQLFQGFQQPSSNTSSIKNTDAGFYANIYPNPTADGFINIDFKSDKNQSVTIKIYNTEGKEIFDFPSLILNNTKVYPLDLSSLSKGQYIFKY